MQQAMQSMQEEDEAVVNSRALLAAKLEIESVSDWPLPTNPADRVTNAAALPRCKWMGTYEDDEDRVFVRWHRAGESFIRELTVIQIAQWCDELAGFEPIQAFRFGMDYQRMLDQPMYQKLAHHMGPLTTAEGDRS